MYIDEDGSSTSQLRCFTERDMVLSISFDLAGFCMRVPCVLFARIVSDSDLAFLESDFYFTAYSFNFEMKLNICNCVDPQL